MDCSANALSRAHCGSGVCRCGRDRGAPTILEDLWLPGAPFKGLTAERLNAWHGPMYAMFETEFGVRMVRAEEKIRAVLPDASQAALLAVPTSTPSVSYTHLTLPTKA